MVQESPEISPPNSDYRFWKGPISGLQDFTAIVYEVLLAHRFCRRHSSMTSEILKGPYIHLQDPPSHRPWEVLLAQGLSRGNFHLYPQRSWTSPICHSCFLTVSLSAILRSRFQEDISFFTPRDPERTLYLTSASASNSPWVVLLAQGTNGRHFYLHNKRSWKGPILGSSQSGSRPAGRGTKWDITFASQGPETALYLVPTLSTIVKDQSSSPRNLARDTPFFTFTARSVDLSFG